MRRFLAFLLVAISFLMISAGLPASTLCFAVMEEPQVGVEDISPLSYSLSDGFFSALFDAGVIVTEIPILSVPSKDLLPAKSLTATALEGGAPFLIIIHETFSTAKPGEYRCPTKLRVVIIQSKTNKVIDDETISDFAIPTGSITFAHKACVELGGKIAKVVLARIMGSD